MVKQQKIQEVEEMRNLLNSYSSVGILNMHKLPGRQLQQIRHSLDNAVIKMNKKSMMLRAIDGANRKDLSKLEDNMKGSTAFIFSNESPFRLFKKLKEKRSPASAKAGDIATKDILIQKGPTGLPPGPAISTLQKIGLKASVQGGKIAVLQDKVVCKAGEAISQNVAAVLSLLKIEPLEIGLDLVSAYEDGIIYSKDVLDINVDDYLNEMQKCVTRGVNLSLNTGYPTKMTIALMIQKAFIETKSLCIETNILEKDFIDEVLMKSIRQALTLEGKIGQGS
jgi:large subunit ribosomal protein L10